MVAIIAADIARRSGQQVDSERHPTGPTLLNKHSAAIDAEMFPTPLPRMLGTELWVRYSGGWASLSASLQKTGPQPLDAPGQLSARSSERVRYAHALPLKDTTAS